MKQSSVPKNKQMKNGPILERTPLEGGRKSEGLEEGAISNNQTALNTDLVEQEYRNKDVGANDYGGQLSNK